MKPRPIPPWSILDRSHPWVPAVATDVAQTFERARRELAGTPTTTVVVPFPQRRKA